eukprot:GHVN01044478.1.p1 GENE.GHVN01044478.1~~GHVN01044478.1.p1  ORF type:complete len:252 (+),score=63.69 GHVN01044478.1:337-1092(+)
MIFTADIPPNQTLYVNNINHRVKVNDLKSNLFDLTVPYGGVIDIIAQKSTPNKCGQAFVVFADIGSSTNAMRALQGHQFLGRPIRISYAKKKSDAAMRTDGTLNRARRKQLQQRLKEKRLAAGIYLPGEEPKEGESSEVKGEGGQGEGEGTGRERLAIDEDEEMREAARQLKALHATTLFIENLPDEMNVQAMEALFKQYPGFLEVRLISARHVAFVDYETQQQADTALYGLDGFKVTPTMPLKISFASKE